MAANFSCPRCGSALPSAEASCTRCILETGISAQESPPLGPGFLDDLPMPGDAMIIADKYRVLETLGRGGMGVVYKSWQENLDRVVAVKTMSSGAHASDVERERFQREARVVAGLCHPAIVSIYDWGMDRGVPFFSMEYVEGRDLGKLLHDGAFEANAAAQLVADLADAIQYAHEQGVFHRDLKPSNVLMDRRGRPKITDFGLAKRIEGGDSLTMSGQLMGSVEYMPPEQISAKKGTLGPWSDVYGLGAILYQVLTKRPPFTGDSLPEVLQQVINSAPVRPSKLKPDVPGTLDAICLKCLEKDPRRRYESARALAEDLRSFLQSEPVFGVKKTGLARRLAAVVVVAVVACAAAWWYLPHVARRVKSIEKMRTEITNTQRPPDSLATTNLQPEITTPNSPERDIAAQPPPTPEQKTSPAFPLSEQAWTNSLGMVFVPVGDSNTLVSIWETRLHDYARFAASSHLTNDAHWLNPGFHQTENDPVVNVSWYDALAFCEWLTLTELTNGLLLTNQSYRLPTDGQWSLAAGLRAEAGRTPKERSNRGKRLFIWGTQWPPPNGSGNFAGTEYNKDKLVPSATVAGFADSYPRTAPVGMFWTNEFGIYDLAGNVWEWCLDSYETGELPKSEFEDSIGKSRIESSDRVLRGGAWDTSERDELVASFRNSLGPHYRRPNIGFRCVLDLGASSRR
jgi:serine/threonine protein kinase